MGKSYCGPARVKLETCFKQRILVLKFIDKMSNTLDYITGLAKNTIKDKVSATQHLAELMGSPHLSFPIVHITGTCGKGSVSTKCARILHASGYKVGLMTSPHLLDYRERYQVDFELMPESYMTTKTAEIREVSQGTPLGYTVFGTVLAFCYFKDMNVDIAVIEVGAGGTSDSTNIVSPIVSVITTVGLDHCQLFGNTIEAIAIEKSGVLKPGRPCVIGPHTPHELLTQIAMEKQCPLNRAEAGQDFLTDNENIVKSVMDILRTEGWNIPNEAIETQIKAKPPLRSQLVKAGETTFVLDAAHNGLAIGHLMKSVAQKYQQFSVVLGVSHTKNPNEFLQEISQWTDEIYLSSWDHPFLHTLESLQVAANEVCPERVKKVGEVDAVLREIVGTGTVHIICGSFFFLEGVLKELGKLGINVPLVWGVREEQAL